MNKRWTPGADDSRAHQKENRTVTEGNENNKHKEIRSIVFSFTVVFIFFSAIFILKHFDKLTFDNFVISLLLVFSIGAFWASHQKKDTNEIMEFKEPKI